PCTTCRVSREYLCSAVRVGAGFAGMPTRAGWSAGATRLRTFGDGCSGPLTFRTLPMPSGVGVLAFAQVQADGHTREVERRAQPVHEIAVISLGQGLRLRAEDDERRRPRVRLRHVAQLDPPSAGSRRRVTAQGLLEPAIEVWRGDA